jgi:hypothetical protein
MRYMLQVYFNGAQDKVAQLPDAERQAIVGEYIALFATPEVTDGNQLQPPATATTVRVHEGETVRTAGPFAATREPLGGYYLVEAAGIDAAVALAARIPAARLGGVVEVRPVVERGAS